MNSKFYKVKCITNLHMGSGDINFNIIDNEVQRDPVTGYASMYSSGIKGALRDHFEALENPEVTNIFGSSIKDSKDGNKNNSKPGRVKFMSANLVMIPVCSSDSLNVYYMVTTKEMLLNAVKEIDDIAGGYTELIKKINELEKYVYAKETLKDKKIGIDGMTFEVKNTMPAEITTFFKDVLGEKGANTVIIPDNDYKKISLPVLARNQLENGISQNLWYEEIVPHKSVFVFGVISDGTEDGDRALESFSKVVEEEPNIQFGGNATVGYGLTKVSRLNIGGHQ